MIDKYKSYEKVINFFGNVWLINGSNGSGDNC